MLEFVKFPKIPRMQNTPCTITEKIDGTNAQVVVPEDPVEPLLVGSRNRVITPGKTTDNYGFAAWVAEHEAMIRRLGPGTHYGEWWGPGVGRGYFTGAARRWSLFNTFRPLPELDPGTNIFQVPVLNTISLDNLSHVFQVEVNKLKTGGSVAAPGFMRPEGVVIRIGTQLFKYVFDKSESSPEEG